MLTFTQTNIGSTLSYIDGRATSYVEIAAKKYASGQRNLVFENKCAFTGGQANIQISVGYPLVYKYVDFYCPGTFSTTQSAFPIRLKTGGINCAYLLSTFEGCRWLYPAQGAGFMDSSNNMSVAFFGCTFEQQNATNIQSPLFNFMNTGFQPGRFLFFGCDFKGFVSGSILHASVSWSETCNINFINCDFGNVTVRTGVLPSINSSSLRSLSTVSGSSCNGSRDFFLETAQGSCEWNSSKGCPTLNDLGKTSPFSLPTINKYNTLADGTRTITVNLLMESTLTWTKYDISCVLTYTNSAGDFVVDDSWSPTAAELTASGAVWSSTAFNGQTWVAREFSLTANVKSGTEISAIIRLHTHVANATLGVFIDPELVVS